MSPRLDCAVNSSQRGSNPSRPGVGRCCQPEPWWNCHEGDLGRKPGSNFQLPPGSLGMGWKGVGWRVPCSLLWSCFSPFSFRCFTCFANAGRAVAGQVPGGMDGAEPGEMDWASKTPKSYTETQLIRPCDPRPNCPSLLAEGPAVEPISLRWALEGIPSPREGQWLKILAL